MIDENFNNKIFFAAKWSTITEFFAKIITPLSTIVLARILTPDVFGIIAVITMIISFLEIFADAGFQKYLIQKEFTNKDDFFRNSDVAFWTNVLFSILIWLFILFFRNNIALIVGNPDLGHVVAISTLQLPVIAFSSIQIAHFKRNMDFKTLFSIRLFSLVIPFVVTLPLAVYGFSYWSIIIGSFTLQIFNAFLLWLKSNWKPNFYYNFSLLRQMLSFSLWTIIESLTIWLTVWIDSLLIATNLNQYFLGLYKTSTSLVNSLLSIITAALLPILFSTLSRLQDDENRFKHVYFKFQKLISIFVLPLGLLLFFYSDLITIILLGKTWNEASNIIGIWGLTSSFMIVFGYFCSEVYRSKGRPKLSVLAQLLHLIFLVPAILISSSFGFWTLVYVRSLLRFQSILVHFIIMKFTMGISIKDTIVNVRPSLLSLLFMLITIILMINLYSSLLWQIMTIFFSTLIYIISIFFHKKTRIEIVQFIKRILQSSTLFIKIETILKNNKENKQNEKW